jgi:cytidine deaminase
MALRIPHHTLNTSDLIESAKRAAISFQASPTCHAGSVGAAVLGEDGNIYSGCCVDAACGIGFCAEHAAVAAMLLQRCSRVVAVVAVSSGGQLMAPCGRCRELLLQINPDNSLTEVLLPDGQTRKLGELLPLHWIEQIGTRRS